MANGTIVANEKALALSAHLESRKETALPHDDFEAGWDAREALIGAIPRERTPVTGFQLVAVLGEVS